MPKSVFGMRAPSNRGASSPARCPRDDDYLLPVRAGRLQRRDTLGGHKFSDLVRDRAEYQRIRS